MREIDMMNIKAGDLIKSYDFSKELQPGCYMIGLVEESTESLIRCKLVKFVFNGEVSGHPAKEFSTIPQGLGMFDDRDTRIELIATKEELELAMEAA